MAEFLYNNAKNASTSHILFKLNYGYYPKVFFKENIDPRSRSHLVNKLAEELKELIEVCYQNLLHAQELQNRAHDKRVKSCSYVPGEKVWLNYKYIKIKQNKKLENKFFELFQVVHKVEKQTYKLDLSTK